MLQKIRKTLRTGGKLSPVESWINSGVEFSIRAIDENATWDVSEIIYIDRARRAGFDLLNVLRGGTDSLHDLARESNIVLEFEDILAQQVAWDH